ncbi:hypothetical protein NAPIS_ORF02155 [Vairimorpha apis BRL 01]|uniref:Uncharacterized protein n=1 Tax=Vairimorpha apis BRL 01 TaxID=1037528 RepID=T0KY18_9MICR|nr:hypothetical protein NAPIS_ORF02155 [Vairimorpha apis BRL 01]
MQPREEKALCALQDRNIFLEKGLKCPHCRDKYKSVEHMATYFEVKSKKIRNHSLQECISNKNVEIRVDTRIPTGIKVKYNKPDVYILDKIKKEILIVEVGITSFDNLQAVETEKKHKYDLLANHCGAMHGYKTNIIPYVMTWEGINVLNIDSRTQAYVQARVLKMTLESLSMEARRGKYITEGEQEVNELENLESHK